MEFLVEYGMFLAKAVTFVLCALLIAGNLLPFNRQQENAEKGELKLNALNRRYQETRDEMLALLLEGKAKKNWKKEQKKLKKAEAKAEKAASKSASKSDQIASDGQKDKQTVEQKAEQKSRVFVLNFDGDIQAKATASLREEITALLSIAKENDEVILRLESAGGVVHGYGFASSQLDRIKKKGLKLTIAVDKVAASGGYMMACVADHIVAAPFAVIGSIGVVAQLPNVHRLLKKNDIDVELHTAGEYKRTLTMIGENTDKAREKFRDDLDTTHGLFKDFVSSHREKLDIESVATGEIWFGTQALEKHLVDEIMTSDELITSYFDKHDVFELSFQPKKSLQEKLMHNASLGIDRWALRWIEQIRQSRFMS